MCFFEWVPVPLVPFIFGRRSQVLTLLPDIYLPSLNVAFSEINGCVRMLAWTARIAQNHHLSDIIFLLWYDRL
jgi:hypothetical protein